MAVASGQEVLMWELINRARLDPAAEAARYGISLNEGLAPGTISASSKQPLAWSDALFTSADQHSQAMVDADFFAHVNPNTNSTPQSRATAAGYAGGAGENIAQRGVSPGSIDPTAAIIQQHADLFIDTGIAGRGHRLNILNGDYRQVGVGQAAGDFQGFSSSLVTQDFGIPNAAGKFITGVAYSDTDHSQLYSVGEGLGNLGIAIGAVNASSQAAGNYALATTLSGSQTIALTGGGLSGAVTFTTVLGNQNIKLDVIDGHTIQTSASGTFSGPITQIRGLGVSGLSLTAGAGSQTMYGTGAGDTLDGGTGDDVMIGGIGDDTYYVNSSTDTTTEALNEGTDLIYAGASFGLQANVENLTLTGTGAFQAIGNGLANVLRGNSGNNQLDGGGGADFMHGFDGADIYIVDNAGDVVIEGSGVDSGYDIVISTANHTLSANVEQLVLQGGATTGTGNDTANYLYGGLSGLSLTLNGAGGDDVLYAGLAGGNTMNGGSGVDTLLLYGGNNQANGGTGSDIYFTYTASDVISEAGGDGIDTVYSNHSITIAEDIEQVILFGSATSATSASLDDNNIIYGNSTSGAVSLSGGGGADVLFGGAFNDTLSGGAGVDLLFAFGGANTLIGGDDTDVYYLESGLDTVTETLTGGFDTIYTQAAGTTALAANVEQLILYGAATGGLGNGAANYLYGHIASQAVTLDGAGGNDYLLDSAFGGDVLTGGAGNDLLDLRTGGNDFIKFAASGSNADLVYGFDANPAGGQDIIDVSGRGFSAGSIGSSIIISAAGADTLVTIGADTIQFIGVVSTDISANDFLF